MLLLQTLLEALIRKGKGFIALLTLYTWNVLSDLVLPGFPGEGSQNFDICVSVLSSPESELELHPEKHREKPFTINQIHFCQLGITTEPLQWISLKNSMY